MVDTDISYNTKTNGGNLVCILNVCKPDTNEPHHLGL